jgi:hypothetical protein
MTDTITTLQAYTPDKLAGLTEPELDVLFAEAYDARFTLTEKVTRAWNSLHRVVGDRRDYRGRGQAWTMNRAEVLRAVRRTTTEEAALAIGRLAQAEGAVELLDETVDATLEAEWNRRGGWTRAYLVEGNNGHVHNTQNCSSCHKGAERTRFVWMTEYSGKSETEIVEDAGERACTICYPSAPVDVTKRPTKMFGPNEIERQKAAAERAAAKAKRDADKAAKAIVHPTGVPLREEAPREENGPQRGSIIGTLHSAKAEMNREAWCAAAWDDKDGRHLANVRHLARAIAWKVAGLETNPELTDAQIAVRIGREADALVEAAQKKATKDVARDRKSQR